MTARAKFDEIVHAPNRLQICAMLAPVDTVEFATARDALGVADSVLSKHVKVLQGAGYVAVRKAAVGSRVRTSLALTKAGRRAYEGHVAALRALVDPAPRTTPVSPG
jgi:DNA-binding MarR family transcriptional regulator